MSGPAQRITVVAPSRLHFGLYGFGSTLPRQFGGIGAMIQSPCISLEILASDVFETSGPLASRTRQFAQRWLASTREVSDLPCHIRVLEVPPEHTGLGVGTQLALAIAAGLNAFCQLPPATPAELAMSVGRGLRSAVGTYGFVQGGLIAERGKLPGETVSPLDMRVELPPAWRFVLVIPSVGPGLAGQAEVQAFERLPPVPWETSQTLIRLGREELMPAAMQQDFSAFSSALFRYCRQAGLCFAEVQGGPYNGPVLAELVEKMRQCGAEGVGQSSWGPTLFAMLPDESSANAFVARLRATSNRAFTTLITAANNTGSRVTAENY